MSDQSNPLGLPWMALNLVSGGGVITDVTGHEICQVWFYGSDNYEQRRDFIIEAVNAHHSLLEQVEKLKARVEELEAACVHKYRQGILDAASKLPCGHPAVATGDDQYPCSFCLYESGIKDLRSENEALAHALQQFREARYEKLDDLIETVREA